MLQSCTIYFRKNAKYGFFGQSYGIYMWNLSLTIIEDITDKETKILKWHKKRDPETVRIEQRKVDNCQQWH